MPIMRVVVNTIDFIGSLLAEAILDEMGDERNVKGQQSNNEMKNI